MFFITKEQEKTIQTALQAIAAGGDEAFAQQWLIWAEIKIHTLNHADKSVVATQLVPLIMVCQRLAVDKKSIDEIGKILMDSLLRIMLQAKLNGRDSLEIIDARKAISYVKERCQK